MSDAPISLALQKVAVLRAAQILEEVYPARIEASKATPDGARTHLAYLGAALETLDRADRGEDIRFPPKPKQEAKSA